MTGGVRLDQLSAADLETYRVAVTERLRQSYQHYQRMKPDRAQPLADRRVASLIAEAGRADSATYVRAIVAGGRRHGTVAYALNRDEGHLFLWDIHVEAASRRTGLGRAAVRLLEEVARGAGLDALRLNAEAGNEASSAFFLALGYQPVSVAMARWL